MSKNLVFRMMNNKVMRVILETGIIKYKIKNKIYL